MVGALDKAGGNASRCAPPLEHACTNSVAEKPRRSIPDRAMC